MKEGINDGYLTPFKVNRLQPPLMSVYTSDDDVIQGEVEQARRYEETDFNTIIEIEEREKKRVEIFLNDTWIKIKSPWFSVQTRIMPFL